MPSEARQARDGPSWRPPEPRRSEGARSAAKGQGRAGAPRPARKQSHTELTAQGGPPRRTPEPFYTHTKASGRDRIYRETCIRNLADVLAARASSRALLAPTVFDR